MRLGFIVLLMGICLGALAFQETPPAEVSPPGGEPPRTGAPEVEPISSPPPQVNSPNPIDAEVNVPVDIQFSWSAVTGAISYDVYFSLARPPLFITNTATTNFNPGTLIYNTTYYWRIDAKNGFGTTTGGLWSFTTVQPPVAGTSATRPGDGLPVAPPPPPPPPKYSLKPLLGVNKVIDVEEEQQWDGNHTIDPGQRAETYSFLRHTKHKYSDEIGLMTSDQRNINTRRTYQVSHLKTNTPGEGRKNETISLQGKTLYLESADSHIMKIEKLEPKEATIISEDYMYVSALNWFYLLLPPESIMIGDSYELNSEKIAEIFFRESYDEKLCKVTGRATLEEEITYQGLPCLKTSIGLKLTRDDPAHNSSQEIEFTGTYIVAKEQQALAELDLGGSFVLKEVATSRTSKRDEKPKKASVRSEGAVIYKLKLNEKIIAKEGK